MGSEFSWIIQENSFISWIWIDSISYRHWRGGLCVRLTYTDVWKYAILFICPENRLPPCLLLPFDFFSGCNCINILLIAGCNMISNTIWDGREDKTNPLPSIFPWKTESQDTIMCYQYLLCLHMVHLMQERCRNSTTESRQGPSSCTLIHWYGNCGLEFPTTAKAVHSFWFPCTPNGRCLG